MNSTDRNLTWYMKWAATLTLIVGTVINSAGFYPLGPLVLIVGGMLWLAVSIKWKEMSLIVVNATMMIAAIGGLLWKYFQ